MRELLDKVYEYINTYKMIHPGDGLVIGLSGGADSVCLLLCMNSLRDRLGIRENGIVAVHINHMIRGDEADTDEEFARQLCNSIGIEFVSYSKDIVAYSKELGSTVEEAGRLFRYECFEKQLKEKKFNKIAVAHNKNDVAETVIFNMVRGSGLKGIAGIPPVRDNIIRPLLDVSRVEIERFLKDNNQDFRTDKTNLTLDYDRNKIRHIVLPTLQELNDKAIEHICLLANDAGEAYEYIEEQALGKWHAELEGKTANASEIISLAVDKLKQEDDITRQKILYEALGRAAGAKKDITRKHVELLEGLLECETGRYLSMPYQVRVSNSYGRIIFTKDNELLEEYSILINQDGEYIIPNWGKLEIATNNVVEKVNIPKKMYTRVADYGKIKDKLCVRCPKENDYIVIDLEGRTKKLSRVFIDNKVDKDVRANWPVVACGDEIIWAIGLRYSEAFRVDDDTKKVIYLEYKGKGDEYVRKNRSTY